MAQIIKLRRGSLEALSAVTASLSKGEIIIASGSSNISVNNGSSIVFAVPENGQVQAVNRFLIGDNAPNVFSAGTYNGMLKGVPYYASGSATLYLLGEGSNDVPNLIGNIQPFSQSVDSRLDSVEASLGGGGSIGSRVAGLEALTGSYNITTASLNSYTASTNTRLNRIEESTSSLNTFSASALTRLARIEESTSSLNTFTSSQNTTNTANAARFQRIEESTASINSYTASLKTAIGVSGTNVTINGDLTVAGTTTQVNSTTIQLGDNIIELNGTGAANGGIYVKDPTAPNTATGSLIWDSTNDYWKAGTIGNESKILLAGGDNVVSGSSQITISSTTGYTTFSSSIATSFSASDARELALSTSVDSRLDTIETSLGGGGSIGARVAALEVFSGSQEQKDVIISAYTASMNAFTASQLQKDSTLQTYTASLDLTIARLKESTASLNLYTQSQDAKNSTLALYTASVDIKFGAVQASTASLNTFTSSQNTTNTANAARFQRIEESTASLNTFSQSANSRLTTLEGAGTIQGVGTGNNVTFASVQTTNNLTVGGDLIVQGNTVTLNVTELVVEDKLINLASGSTNATQADGAGIAINGASASFTYAATPNAWTTNIPISSSAITASLNVPGFGSSKRIAFRETTGNIDFVTAPTTAGDLVQWNGTAFTMSNVIDGGSF